MVHGRWLMVAIAAMLLTGAPGAASAQEPVPHAIVFDTYMSPAAGAEGLLTIQHLLASVEDRWLPRKVGQERSRRGLALGILYRSGKFMALDCRRTIC